MKHNKIKSMVQIGLLFALACVLSVMESMLTAPLLLPPGIKIGLANVVVMYAFLLLGKGNAFFLICLKTLFSCFTRGMVAGLLSFCGSLTAFACLWMIDMICRQKESFLFLSVFGAVGHNLGQLVTASILLGSSVYGYAPVLLLSGIAVGVLTGILLKLLLPALKKEGLFYKKNQQHKF